MKLTENSTISINLIIMLIGAAVSFSSCQSNGKSDSTEQQFREQVLQRLTAIETTVKIIKEEVK